MSKKYDVVVCIGRYEPLHKGHINNIQQAKELGDKVVILLGSAFQPRTIKNPFTYEERKQILTDVFGDDIICVPIRDYLYQEHMWMQEVQEAVSNVCNKNQKPKVAILGYEKDNSSYYLTKFPMWDFVSIAGYAQIHGKVVDATLIRELYFSKHTHFIKSVVHPSTYDFLIKFSKSNEYKMLVDEFEFIKEYKSQWKNSPYEPTFNTADAVVVEGGHVLLVKRKHSPGKGLWALPGGFVNSETSYEAAKRELYEETSIKVPEKVIDGSLKYEKHFDHTDRSLRGRTFTMAYLFELEGSPNGKLPKVRGADDADEAKWVTLADVDNMSDVMFEDHFSIVQMMKSRLG